MDKNQVIKYLTGNNNPDHDVLEKLLEPGVELLSPKGNGGTLLFGCIPDSRFYKVAKKLLELGLVDINAKNNKGMTALHVACIKANVEMVKLLLEHDADTGITITNTEKDTPTDTGITPLAFAISESEIPKSYKKKNNAPFFIADPKKVIEVVKLLIEKGANVNCETKSKTSPLSKALITKRTEVSKMLIEAGANISDAILYEACDNGESKIAELLIRKGADVNYQNTIHKQTALYVACYNGDMKTIKILIKNGANINAETEKPLYENHNKGKTAIEIAIVNGYSKIVKFLMNNPNLDADVKKSLLHIACKHRQKNIVKMLIDSGVNIETLDVNGETPLSVACISNLDADVIRMLMNNNANCNFKDKNGNNLLHTLAQNRCFIDEHTKVASTLLARGLDINAQNKAGWTALHFASFYGNTECFELLFDADADRELADNEGKTALDLAKEQYNKPVEIATIPASVYTYFSRLLPVSVEPDKEDLKAIIDFLARFENNIHKYTSQLDDNAFSI